MWLLLSEENTKKKENWHQQVVVSRFISSKFEKIAHWLRFSLASFIIIIVTISRNLPCLAALPSYFHCFDASVWRKYFFSSFIQKQRKNNNTLKWIGRLLLAEAPVCLRLRPIQFIFVRNFPLRIWRIRLAQKCFVCSSRFSSIAQYCTMFS